MEGSTRMIGNGVEATPLGIAPVDSGVLLVVDCRHVVEGEGLTELLPGESPGEEVEIGDDADAVKAVVVKVDEGDVGYPVFLLRKEGQAVGLFIDFLPAGHEDPPDPL
jgi:hypothetical protein